jgi:hypothetical protein
MEGATKNSGYIHGLTSVVMVRPRSSAGAGGGVAVARGHLFLVLALAEDPESTEVKKGWRLAARVPLFPAGERSHRRSGRALPFSSVSSLASPCSINGVAWYW